MDEAKTLFSVDKQERRTMGGTNSKEGSCHHVCLAHAPVPAACRCKKGKGGKESGHFNTALIRRHLVGCPGEM